MSWCVQSQTPSLKFTSNEAPSAVLLKKLTPSLKRYNYTKCVTIQSIIISQTLFSRHRMSWCVQSQTPSQKFTSNEAPSAVLLKKLTSSLKRYNYTKCVTIQSVIISQTLFKQAQNVVMRAIANAIAEVHQQRSTKCSAPEETDVIAQKV